MSRRATDSGAAGCAVTSAEDADCAHQSRLRVSGIQDQARASRALRCAASWVEVPRRERFMPIPSEKSIRSVQRSGPAADQATDTLERPSRSLTELNPIVRGWGQYYKRSRVRKLFTQLDAWIVRRLWSHRCKRWRVQGWKQLPQSRLYGELGLVSLLQLHPSGALSLKGLFVKAACGRTCTCSLSGGRRPALLRWVRLLRPDSGCRPSSCTRGDPGRLSRKVVGGRSTEHWPRVGDCCAGTSDRGATTPTRCGASFRSRGPICVCRICGDFRAAGNAFEYGRPEPLRQCPV